MSMKYETKRYRVPVGPNGAGAALGTIQSITDDVAQVRLDAGSLVAVSLRTVRGKSARLREGERWLLDSHYGNGWEFASYINSGDDRQPGWQVPALQSGWANFSDPATGWVTGTSHYASAGYCLDADQMVRLRGTVAGPSVSAADAAGPVAADIFRLPSWAWPDADGILLFATASGQVKVYPDGWVRAVTGSASKVALDGVAFLAV